ALGLAARSHVRDLVSHFRAAHPNWNRPTQTARYDSGPSSVGYWAPAGWALGTVEPRLATVAARSIREAALATQRAWPFTPSDSGQLILLETWNVPASSSTGSHAGRTRDHDSRARCATGSPSR